MGALTTPHRNAVRRPGRVALALALALAATLAQAQTGSAQDPARTASKRDWMDYSTWADWTATSSWWPWRSDAKPPPTGVESPHYGDSLFYFFQGRYFTSVTQLMASQHFGRTPPHADEAEILRGGLYLSYGLHREAGEVFARLIERGAPQPVRDRAWFYLAKIRYQRGLLAGSEEALARIEKPLPGALEEDRALLQANVLMARGKYGDAIMVLDTLAKSGTSSYVRYNLGVALIRNGDLARGTALLDGVGKLPATTEEYRALRDKANVALGFAALAEDRGADARNYLERVRLNGMHSNKALLGFGWASAAQGQMKVALVPWNELATRDASDAAVLEAKLAVSYAHAELGADGQALALYQEAIGVFDRESVHLDESIAAIRDGRLVDGLIGANPGEEMGWFWNIAELPDSKALPHAGHLAQVLASHEFQESFKNYRDLRFLARNLQQWQESLNILRDMLANRRQAHDERLPKVRAGERGLNLDNLAQRHDALAAELERVERETDVAAFATPRERELQVRLDRVRETLAQSTDPGLATARERYRRAAGALLWQQSDQFAVRLWNARKGMQELQRNLAEARERDAALATAQIDEPTRLDQFAGRIDALAARVDAMVPRLVALTQEQQNAVQELAAAELLRQKERLAGYGTQARFAVAQIYDRASLAKEGGRAAAR